MTGAEPRLSPRAAPDRERLPLSVVVPTRDRPDMLGSCLGALAAALDPGDELIVADSASADEEATARVARASGAIVVRCSAPGASRARNVGAAAAAHDLIAFVDDDVRVDGAWAEALVRCFASDDAPAFVTGRIMAPDHRRYVAIMDDQEAVVFDRAFAGRMGHSASLAVRRAAFEAVGGFDVMLGAGARFRASEDGDLLDRLLSAGYSGRHEPAALAWHEQWRTRRQLVGLNYAYGIGAGAALAKLRRLDTGRARLRRDEYVAQWGFGNLAESVRARAKFDSVTSLVRLVGLGVGFCTGALTPIGQGHYRERLESHA